MRNANAWTFFIPSVRRCIFAVLIGAVATVSAAWGCAAWAPTRYVSDFTSDPVNATEITDPDGQKGLYFQESGIGWSYMWLRGERSADRENPHINWTGPYGGTYHQLEGWPFKAVRSR